MKTVATNRTSQSVNQEEENQLPVAQKTHECVAISLAGLITPPFEVSPRETVIDSRLIQSTAKYSQSASLLPNGFRGGRPGWVWVINHLVRQVKC